MVREDVRFIGVTEEDVEHRRKQMICYCMLTPYKCKKKMCQMHLKSYFMS